MPVVFPSVEIGGTGPRSGELNAGTERFSGANSLDQDILELTDDFTFIRGSHTITIGTHNEFFKFKNLFLSDFYGYYYFPTLADFENGLASQYSITLRHRRRSAPADLLRGPAVRPLRRRPVAGRAIACR